MENKVIKGIESERRTGEGDLERGKINRIIRKLKDDKVIGVDGVPRCGDIVDKK